MKSAIDKGMVNTDGNEINLSHMITVYGFSQDSITMHKTCNFDISLKEQEDGQVSFEMTA